MIDARLFGYIALAFVALLLYQAWVEDYGPREAAPPAEVEGARAPGTADVPRDLPELGDIPAEAPDEADTPAPQPQPSAAADTARLIEVHTDVLSLKIDLRGGTVAYAALPEYPVDLEHPDNPVQIFGTESPYYVAQSGLMAKDAPAPDHYALYRTDAEQYRLQEGDDVLRVPLRWQTGDGLSVTKTFVFERGRYEINVLHRVDNATGQPWLGRQYRQLQRTYADEGGRAFIYTYTGGVIYSPDNKYEKIDFEEMAEKPLERQFAHGWAAMIQHYFLAAWIPRPEQVNSYYSLGAPGPDGLRYVLGLKSPFERVEPGASTEFASTLYVGPKIQERLKEIAPGLRLTVDYGWLTVISQPLFWLLETIHDFVGNWGWSIVLVTLLIKLVFYKLAETSYRSMANMRRVQPKMMQIRERYADDRQRQSQAMMELYKKEKINPLGGCLPMVIQIPVFIALYWVLLESVELRQAPWILWIEDLSVRDPYFVLPLIMGVSMYFQQKLNPAPVDPVQAKVFMVLPFVFTVFFAFFPAGLVLYWVVNNLLTIAQQWYITRKVMGDEPAKKKKK